MPNQRPAQPELDAKLFFDVPQMRAFTRVDSDGVEHKYIGGTGSSTAEDFYGSTIHPEAQVKMLNKLTALAGQMSDEKSGLTAFLNHSYKIPEDTLGMFTSARLSTRTSTGVDGVAGGTMGVDYIDLDIEARVVESNPRALAAWEQVREGVRHGWSIGAYFLDVKWKSDDPNSEDFWKMDVFDVELLEISLVGIPANQRCWVRTVEDLTADAIKAAEKIARDATLRERATAMPADRLQNIRNLACRSIVKHDDDERIEQRASALDFRRIAEEPSDEMTDEIRGALLKAADLIEKRADEPTMDPTSPSDGKDELITASVRHVARAVGHGICVRSAGHLAKALECMSMAIGADGGTAAPSGDEDPNEMSADLASAIAELRTAHKACLDLLDAPDTPQQEVDVILGCRGAAVVKLLEVADTNTASPIIRELPAGLHVGDDAPVAQLEAGSTTCAYFSGCEALNVAGRAFCEEHVRDAADGDGKDSKKPYGSVEYADPGYQPDGVARYPLDTEEHVKAAASYFGKQSNRDKYTVTQQKHIDGKIEAAEKRHGIHPDDEHKRAMERLSWLDNPPTSIEQLTAEVTKLEPKAGDVIVLSGDGISPEQLAELARAHNDPEDRHVTFLSMPEGTATLVEQSAEIAEQLAAAQTDLLRVTGERDVLATQVSTLAADVGARTSELATLNASIETAKAEFDVAQKALDDKKQERLGRLHSSSASDVIKSATDLMQNNGSTAFVDPALYNMNEAERLAALARQVTGGAPPAEGRDRAINA